MLAALIATRNQLGVVPFLPNGILEVPYSATLLAVGGLGPYTWALISGSLPAGLTLASNGSVSGTPTAIGKSKFVVQVTDSLGTTATGTITVDIGLYGNQFVAATTTFPCIAFAKRAAALTTDPAIAHQLLFTSAGQYSVRDAIEAQYVKLISQNASDDPIYLNHNIFLTIPFVAQLSTILSTLPVSSDNLLVLADLQQRTQYALFVLQQDLFIFPE